MPQDFFVQRPSVTPTIYAYVLQGVASHKGYIKVGFTDRTPEVCRRKLFFTFPLIQAGDLLS